MNPDKIAELKQAAEKVSTPGEAFYLAMYGEEGGVWIGVEERHRPIWEAKAQDFLRRFQPALLADLERQREALENLVIAIGMGWDLDGVLQVARAALQEAPSNAR